MAIRQKLLLLCLRTADPTSGVCAWAAHDGSGHATHTTGDTEDPPYESVMAAMRDGWRVIQYPIPLPSFPGSEHRTSFLKHEFVLERLVDLETSEPSHV